jgi:hypothetical protein
MSPATPTTCTSEHQAITGRTVLACAWPALVLATICLLPFLNKPFLIDDPEFLGIARQILKSPLHPTNFNICWNITPYCAKLYELTPGNTLMGYALVPTVLGGAAEWMAHTTQLFFVCAAVLAMSSFILRTGRSRGHAVVGAMLLVAIPPFLPMASTAMPDVLALAIGLVGMERLAAWRDERKWRQGATAALALGFAGIARPHLTLLLPLGAFFLLESMKPHEILRQIRRSPSLWLPVAAGGVVLIAAILATRERGVLLNPPTAFSGPEHLLLNLRSYLFFFCFPLPLAACWAAVRWGARRTALTLIACMAVALLVGIKQIILALIGGYVLADILLEAWKNEDREGMFLGLWLLVPLPIVYYGHLPIKYLLPCMPAIILICFRLGVSVPVRIARTACLLIIAGGLAYSLLILRADAEFARFGRDALNSLIRQHAAVGEKVWFPNEFSANWYARLAGAKLLIPGRQEPTRGDLLVTGTYDGGTEMLKTLRRSTLVQVLTHKYRFGRTQGGGAGLYTNYYGNLPWTPRSGEEERYELWRFE